MTANRQRCRRRVGSGLVRLFAVLPLCLLLAGIGGLLSRTADAHDIAIAVLDLQELRPGEFIGRWAPTPGIDVAALQPIFPPQCTWDPPKLACGSPGLNGSISFGGLGQRQSAVMYRVARLDGSTRVYTLTAAQPTLTIADNPDSVAAWLDLALAYTSVGIGHILLGVDHLLFVLGLIFLVRSTAMLVKTITAFTVAHSLSLAAATFGWVGVPERAVSASIALSIVFVGVELLRSRRGMAGLTIRHPWVVAFAFGLLHGLGFASALGTLGIPRETIPYALLFFNIGVEIGQLAFVAVVVALRWAHRTVEVRLPSWSDTLAAYAIGSIASFWFISRMAAILVT